MNTITTDIARVQSRISEIQSRIKSMLPQAAPPDMPEDSPDGATQPASPSSNISVPFETALHQARGVQSLPAAVQAELGAIPGSVAPDGETVRPIDMAGLTGTNGYDVIIDQSAKKYGVDPALVRAVMQTESSGDPNAVSHAGAMGLMQLMPSDAKQYGVGNPFDPIQNIDGGAHQLSDLLKQYNGNLDLALAGYNAGPGNVAKYGGVPPFKETQDYVRKIKGLLGH